MTVPDPFAGIRGEHAAPAEQLGLDVGPAGVEQRPPCTICGGAGGWRVLTNDDGDRLPPPGEWVECWACDDDPERRRR